MGRIRTIKPEFPQSESIGRLSRDARLLFIMLWTIADDHGRARANSRMLASLLYPYDDDAAGLMETWLSELEGNGSIRRYEVDGDTYLDIPKWKKHQKVDKPSDPKYPEYRESPRDNSRALPESSLRIKDQGREGIKEEETPSGRDALPLVPQNPSSQPSAPKKPTEDDGADPNGSDEDRYWHLAGELKAKGIARSQCGQLAKALNGDFERGLAILRDTVGAKGSGSAYLAKIIKNIQQENTSTTTTVPPDGTPTWIIEARAEGAKITRQGDRWRWGFGLYDEKGDQVGG